MTLMFGLFAASGAVVWLAGVQLARCADAIAERTGLAREVLGLVLLGGVTSLPELAVAVTATLQGTPALTVNDVLGSAAINIVIIALADFVVGRGALTSMQVSSGVILQGILGMLILTIALAASITGDVLVLGIGGWSWVLLLAYLGSIRLLANSNVNAAWTPAAEFEKPPRRDAAVAERSLRSLIIRTIVAGACILVAGFFLARSGAAIAEETGLGESFFGVIFLAFSTSLPEISTVFAAVRLRRYEMAISDVFGTNLFNVTIIVVVDALHPGGPVLLEVGRTAGFAAFLTIMLTAIVLIGLLERRNLAFLRMGVDSIGVVLIYAVGVAIMYALR